MLPTRMRPIRQRTMDDRLGNLRPHARIRIHTHTRTHAAFSGLRTLTGSSICSLAPAFTRSTHPNNISYLAISLCSADSFSLDRTTCSRINLQSALHTRRTHVTHRVWPLCVFDYRSGEPCHCLTHGCLPCCSMTPREMVLSLYVGRSSDG